MNKNLTEEEKQKMQVKNAKKAIIEALKENKKK